MLQSKKRKKVGLDSRYYLYVKFLPAFQKLRKDFTYNSDDTKGYRLGLEKLIKRVVNGSIKGKYEYAKLVDRHLNQVLSIWTAKDGQLSWENYLQGLKQGNKGKAALKGSVAFMPTYQARRSQLGLPPLLTVLGIERKGNKCGIDIALESIYAMVAEGQYADDWRAVYCYQADQKVASFNRKGLTFHCAEFKRSVLSAGNVDIHSLII